MRRFWLQRRRRGAYLTMSLFFIQDGIPPGRIAYDHSPRVILTEMTVPAWSGSFTAGLNASLSPFRGMVSVAETTASLLCLSVWHVIIAELPKMIAVAATRTARVHSQSG